MDTKSELDYLCTGTSMNSVDASAEWFSMEIERFVITATGREIHISKLTNVLSFRCICPKCGECFPDKRTLKLHCREDHAMPNANSNEDVDDSSPSVSAGGRVFGENNTNDSIEPAKFDGEMERDGDGLRDDVDDLEADDGDNDSSTTEDYNDSFGPDNGTSEAGDTFGTGIRTVRSNDSNKRTPTRNKRTLQSANTSTDRDTTGEDSVAIGAAGKKPYKCTDCGRAYKKERGLKAHRKIHSANLIYKCRKCDKQLLSAETLKIHMKLHTREMPYPCTICDRGFLRQEALDHHIRKHKIESLINESQNHQLTNPPPAKPVEEKAALNFECEICGLNLFHRDKYTEHMCVHTGEKPYVCAVCDQSYSIKHQLHTHYRTHLGEDVHQCHECGKRFPYPSHLKVHSRIHTGEKPFMCSICGKTFAKKSGLTLHTKRHNKDFAYKCQDCGKTFPTAWALKSHRWSHTGEKPFLCPTCGKGFTGYSRFKEHKMIHTGEKPYVCKVCGKAFNQAHCLKDHVAIHEDNPEILCSFCGKSCKHRSALNAHVRNVHRENQMKN